MDGGINHTKDGEGELDLLSSKDKAVENGEDRNATGNDDAKARETAQDYGNLISQISKNPRTFKIIPRKQ